MGKSYCEEFARRGFNICIVARNPEKEQAQADKLKSEFNTQTRFITADFKDSAEPLFFEKIVAQLDDLDIGILVNNVGILENYPFDCHKPETCRDMVLVNTLPQVMFTKLLLSKLEKRQYRSAVINMASYAAMKPTPGMAIYAATKAFNDFISRALAEEFKDKIDFLSVRPKRVSTPMTENVEDEQADWHWIEPEEVVKAALRDLGYEAVTIGHWKHELHHVVQSFMALFQDKKKISLEKAKDLYVKEHGMEGVGHDEKSR